MVDIEEKIVTVWIEAYWVSSEDEDRHNPKELWASLETRKAEDLCL